MGIPSTLDIVHDERAALDHLAATAYDVVVSDYDLGPDNGLQVLGHVRKLVPTAQRVLLTSAPEQAKSEMRRRGDNLAHIVLDKRSELATIRDQLRSVFQLRQ